MATVDSGGANARSDSSVAHPPEPHDAAKLARAADAQRRHGTGFLRAEPPFTSPGAASVARMLMVNDDQQLIGEP